MDPSRSLRSVLLRVASAVVDDGTAGEPGGSGGQEGIAGHGGELGVRGDDRDEHSRQPAVIGGISLDLHVPRDFGGTRSELFTTAARRYLEPTRCSVSYRPDRRRATGTRVE